MSPPARARTAVIVLAAGSGSRIGAPVNKALLPLAGRSVLAWSLRSVRQVDGVGRVVLVIAKRDRSLVQSALAGDEVGPAVRLVVGGDSRHASEWCGVQSLAGEIDDGEIDIVVVHDAARPLAGAHIFDDVIEQARAHGGGVPVRPTSALVRAEHVTTPLGETVVMVQTPQAFRAGALLSAFQRADRAGFTGTDTASCVEAFTDLTVRTVPAPAQNIKITFADDLLLAEHLIGGRRGPSLEPSRIR